MAMPRLCACGSIMARHSASTSDNSTGSRDRLTVPDSISARSRISLISSSRYQPAFKIWSMLRFCSGVGGGLPESTSCANPKMALSGVRSSWLMLEMKSVFARLAFSAAISASPSCCCTRFRAELSVPISK